MQTEDIIRRAVTAYNEGDEEGLDPLLSDGLRYRVNGQPDSGRFHCDVVGKPDFYDAVGRILDIWEVADYRIVDLIVSGDRGAAQIACSATHKGTRRHFDTRLALFFTVGGGRITGIEEYHDTAAMAQDR